MDISSFFKRNWPHFLAIGLFLVIVCAYFSKQLEGYGVKQHDVEQFTGAAHEIATYREHHDGKEPLWTNSMFGGMPATQISVIYDGNLFAGITKGFLSTFPSPMGLVLLYMICFYIGMCMMKVNKWVAMVGAIAFAFMSYDIIIIQVGHASKAVAIAYLVPVLGAFWMAYRRNWIWGALLSAIFMAFEMAANHLQVTYYFGFLLLGLGLAETFRAIRDKQIGRYLKATVAVIAAYGLAMAVNYANIKLTADYADNTIRGGNDVTINNDGTSNKANSTTGLNRDYVTEYSYGIDETFTLLSPYVKGGGAMYAADSPFTDKIEDNLTGDQYEAVMNSNIYWGDQPATAGPVYVGVILILLALLGLFYIKDPMKYALLLVTILVLLLSWGKNYPGLTNWFLDHVPGYDKFRAITIILVIAELTIPVLGVLFLDRLVKERDKIKTNSMPFYAITGGFVLFLIIMRFAGIDKSYLSTAEADPELRLKQEKAVIQQIAGMDSTQLVQYGIDRNNSQQISQIVNTQLKGFDDRMEGLKIVRKEIYNSSMNRSILFALLGALALLLIFLTEIPVVAGVVMLGLLMMIDLMGVARNYLNNDESGSGYRYWETRLNTTYPLAPKEGDETILAMETAADPQLKRLVEAGRQEGRAKAMELDATGSEASRIENAYAFAALNENTDYRVFDFTGGFNSARASYFHKSIGGYHGAKLISMQNLFTFHLAKSNSRVMDMMNIKYFLQPASQDPNAPLIARPNPTAMGNGWIVKNVKVVPNADQEILSLGSRFDIRNEGTGKLFVNHAEKREAIVYGSENLQYLPAGAKDTMSVQLSNGLPIGLEVYMVADAKNQTATVPKQTLDADTANSFRKLFMYRMIEEFHVRDEAIVRSDMAKKLSQKQYKGEGTVKLTHYAPNQLDYTVTSSDKGLAVFSEVYYPEGWTATINGKPADILRVNYVLRGLEVPKGTSKVEFKFDLPKYHSLNRNSLFVSLIVLLLPVAYGIMLYMRRRKNGTSETVETK